MPDLALTPTRRQLLLDIAAGRVRRTVFRNWMLEIVCTGYQIRRYRVDSRVNEAVAAGWAMELPGGQAALTLAGQALITEGASRA